MKNEEVTAHQVGAHGVTRPTWIFAVQTIPGLPKFNLEMRASTRKALDHMNALTLGSPVRGGIFVETPPRIVSSSIGAASAVAQGTMSLLRSLSFL